MFKVGHKHSKEVLKKLSLALKGRKPINSKKILDTLTNKEYLSMKDCSVDTGHSMKYIKMHPNRFERID